MPLFDPCKIEVIILFHLNKLFNPSVDASQTPFSVIKPVTYLAGVISNAKFIALLFFG